MVVAFRLLYSDYWAYLRVAVLMPWSRWPHYGGVGVQGAVEAQMLPGHWRRRVVGVIRGRTSNVRRRQSSGQEGLEWWRAAPVIWRVVVCGWVDG